MSRLTAREVQPPRVPSGLRVLPAPMIPVAHRISTAITQVDHGLLKGERLLSCPYSGQKVALGRPIYVGKAPQVALLLATPLSRESDGDRQLHSREAPVVVKVR